MNQNRIIVPLDGMAENQALAMAEMLQGYVWGFKVNDLLIDCGLSIITKLKKYGPVFADPKLHDIPNTVANGIKKLDAAGADLITVHASGGRTMLEAAAQAAKNSKILAVTVLTSITPNHCEEIYGRKPESAVENFARISAESGIHGIVCSPKEVSLLKDSEIFSKLLKVIPGIRPSWSIAKDDQARVMTPKQAIEEGADLLVIGRPITGHADPRHAAEMVAQELTGL